MTLDELKEAVAAANTSPNIHTRTELKVNAVIAYIIARGERTAEDLVKAFVSSDAAELTSRLSTEAQSVTETQPVSVSGSEPSEGSYAGHATETQSGTAPTDVLPPRGQLEQMTNQQLRDLATKFGKEVPNRANKEALLAALLGEEE